jgi:iron complex outermembrane receptor protein
MRRFRGGESWKGCVLRLVAVGAGLCVCAAAAAAEKSVTIPSEDLKTALLDYIKQSRIELIFDPDQLRGLHSQAISGTYAPADALALMLQDTGTVAIRDTTGAFVIVKRTSAARAEDAVMQRALETVVVTGTSIRGSVDVGANIITLDRDATEATGANTVQELLSSVPAITGFGNGGAEFHAGAFENTGENLPTIHSLGASSSQSTLILLDGHPMVPSGQDGYTDPAIIPIVALQRVDIVPDAESAIYGSSAVAGVINFVTRPSYQGVQAGLQYGEAADFNNVVGSLLAGTEWSGGSIYGAYEFKSNSTLSAGSRSFSADQDLRHLGGSNFRSYNCSPATIAASSAGTAGIFAYPYTSAAIAVAGDSQSGICDYTPVQGIIPSATTHSFFASVQQVLGRAEIRLDVGYHTRINNDLSPQAPLSATAFGPTGASDALGAGSQNPFFVGNGATGTASEFVRYDLTNLIGPAVTKTGVRAIYANLAATLDLGGAWAAEFTAVAGMDDSFLHGSNQLCQACALLALNGTTNTTGQANNSPSTTALGDPYELGTTSIINRVLNTGNALDVWNPAQTNRTSATVISELKGDATNSDYATSLNQVDLKFDGPLLQTAAGPVKAAMGMEYSQYHNTTRSTASNSTGPTSSSSRFTYAPLARSAYAAFAEIYLPLISSNMSVPLVQSLELQLAGRYDSYSDVGDTLNPRVGLAWKVVDGLTGRASYGTSFTAPNLDGLSPIAFTTVTARSVAFAVPAGHPNYAGSFCAAASGPCNVSATMQGIAINSGNPNLQPMRGLSYSFGLDMDAGALLPVLRGLSANVTYWQAKFLGGVTQPTLQNVLTVPGLQNLLLLAPPGGWTINSPAVQTVLKGLPITNPLPSTIYYVYDGIRVNGLNVQANGIDFDAHYRFDTDRLGSFSAEWSGSEKLRFDIKGGPPNSTAPYVSFLNGHQDTSVLKAMQFATRLALGWERGPLAATLSWNFTNPYWFQSSNPPFNTLGLAPSVGAVGTYQKVSANSVFNLNLRYRLVAPWAGEWSQGLRLDLTVINLADSPPPFYDLGSVGFNTTFTGYDIFNADPIGRQIRIGITKTL